MHPATGQAQEGLGPDISARGPKAPESVWIRFAPPYLNLIFLSLIFSLDRLRSDGLSLNLHVFLGSKAPTGRMWQHLMCLSFVNLISYLFVMIVCSLVGFMFHDFIYLSHRFFEQ